MASNPGVSVVIATYNRAGLLAETVDSVLRQTYENLELIVVDDGSDDDTLDQLAGREDERLRVLPLEHCGVLGRLKNIGLATARGELVAFLDSDDVWLPNKLERQVAVLDRNPAVGLVCSNAQVIDDDGVDRGTTYLPAGLGASGEVLEELLATNFVIGSSAVVRRALYERVGRFSEAPELRPADGAWFARSAPNCSCSSPAPQRREVGARVAARTAGQALRNDPGAALALSLRPITRRLDQVKSLAAALRSRHR